MKRDKACGEIREADIGSPITIEGWVSRRRDHGGLIFIDLRDRSGVCQVVFSPDTSRDAHERAHDLRAEFVISVSGEIRKRPEGTENPNLPTGMVEMYVKDLIVLNEAAPLPYSMEEAAEGEALRLRHRYLDLRRPEMQHNIIVRHRTNKLIRDYLDEQGFLDIETPMLTKSTPEGARDYLVPSRLNPGHFYALPQSPQLFKQILMVAGFERYFQIVKCFRDEDLRADRQPEFTQVDLEMSFVDRMDVIELIEGMIYVDEQQLFFVRRYCSCCFLNYLWSVSGELLSFHHFFEKIPWLLLLQGIFSLLHNKMKLKFIEHKKTCQPGAD